MQIFPVVGPNGKHKHATSKLALRDGGREADSREKKRESPVSYNEDARIQEKKSWKTWCADQNKYVHMFPRCALTLPTCTQLQYLCLLSYSRCVLYRFNIQHTSSQSTQKSGSWIKPHKYIHISMHGYTNAVICSDFVQIFMVKRADRQTMTGNSGSDLLWWVNTSAVVAHDFTVNFLAEPMQYLCQLAPNAILRLWLHALTSEEGVPKPTQHAGRRWSSCHPNQNDFKTKLKQRCSPIGSDGSEIKGPVQL